MRTIDSFACVVAIAIITCACATSGNEKNSTPGYTKRVISASFISEGVAVADVNNDGQPDILAGPHWFEAPEYIEHDIYEQEDLDSANEYSNSFLNFSLDVNHDGWMDLIVVGLPGEPAVWYENPQRGSALWKKYSVNDSVGIGNESPHFVDMDGDGRNDILCADPKAKQIVWLKSPDSDFDQPWQRYAISEPDAPGTHRYSHGLGYADVNGDGRRDVMINKGWWENPGNDRQGAWTFHPADWGEDCAHMYLIDVNQDGLSDVVSSSAHKYGIWWYEQQKAADGTISWSRHLIHDKVSQTHSLTMADLNGDGQPEFITGKRLFAHNDTDVDPGAREPSKLLLLELKPSATPMWTVHELDSASGVGLNVAIADMDADEVPDIVVSNKKGTYLFQNTGNR